MRRLLGAAVIVAGGAAFTACLLSANTGMRDVMDVDGGFCASGGPYVVAHQCSGADARLLLVGILGGLLAAAVYAGGTTLFGRSGSSAGLAGWVAVFGAFGWNFISLGIHPAAGQGPVVGFLISGVVFWALALGGLLLLFTGLASDLRRGSGPDPRVKAMPPLVRAVIPPGPGVAYPDGCGLPAAQPVGDSRPDQRGQMSVLASVVIWMLASLGGAAIGVALS